MVIWVNWYVVLRYFSESYGPKPSILIKIFVKGLYNDLGYFENGRFETANISPAPTRTNMPLKSNFVQMRLNFINIMEFSSTIHSKHHNSLLKVFQIFKKYRLICKICVIFQLSTQLHSAPLSFVYNWEEMRTYWLHTTLCRLFELLQIYGLKVCTCLMKKT